MRRLSFAGGQLKLYIPEIDAAGQVVGWMANIFEETDRRNAEDALAATRARFDFVATSADVGVWSCDLPFAELIWNQACTAAVKIAIGAWPPASTGTSPSRSILISCAPSLRTSAARPN